MNTVKKLLFMLMLTAGCADLHAPIIYYNIGEKLKRALIVNQADIGTKTWEKFLREEFQDDNLTFHVTVNNCESFKVNQIIREEHFQVFLDSSYTRIMVTRSKQLVAPAPAAAETASADTALAAAAESPKKNDGDSGSSDDDDDKALQPAKNMLLREERRKKVSSICTWVLAVAATVIIAHKAGLASEIGNAVQ
jgi:hypothetical protein